MLNRLALAAIILTFAGLGVLLYHTVNAGNYQSMENPYGWYVHHEDAAMAAVIEAENLGCTQMTFDIEVRKYHVTPC